VCDGQLVASLPNGHHSLWLFLLVFKGSQAVLTYMWHCWSPNTFNNSSSYSRPISALIHRLREGWYNPSNGPISLATRRHRWKLRQLIQCECFYTVSRKGTNSIWDITSSNTDRFSFSKFLHFYNLEICNKAVIKHPIAPKTRHYTTLWNIDVRK